MATDADKNQASEKNDEQKKVVFSEEQQAKVNELIQDAMGRAGREARERAAALEQNVATLTSKLTAAEEALKNASTKTEKSNAKADVDALSAQIEEMKRAGQTTAQELEALRAKEKALLQEAAAARNETLSVRKQVAIQSAAGKVNFVDVSIVAKLTEDSIKWDEAKKTFIVVNEQGQPRLNASFDPMSLEEFYTDFAAKNPYLVRGDVKPGVGSSQNKRFDVSGNGKFTVTDVFGPKSDSKKATQLMKDDPAEYRRLKTMAKEQGLIA